MIDFTFKEDNGRDSKVAGGKAWMEGLILVLMLAVSFGLNLATSSRFPLPWQDEIAFTDVAVNTATGQGFISTVAMCGDPSIQHFWSCNAPLYPLILSRWIQATGFTIPGVRSLNYVLILLCVLTLWAAVKRLDLVRSARYRLLFAGLLLCGYGMGFIFRSARYDCLCLLVMSLVPLSYTLKPARARLLAIFLLGVVAPFAGIQLILYSIVLCAVVLLFLRQRVIWEVLALGAGEMVGAASLIGFFYTHGVLANFRSAISGERTGRFQYMSKDPSFALLLLVCLLLVGTQLFRGKFKLRSLLGAALACGILIPAGMLLLGKFPIYYSWMAFVPLAMLVCGALSRERAGFPRGALLFGALGMATVFLIGLPVQLASALYYWNGRDCARIDAMDQQYLASSDWVYTQYSGYFAARKVTDHVFMPFLVPEPYKDKVNVLIVSPSDYKEYVHAIMGGEWRDTGIGIADTERDLLPNNSAAILLQRRIDLHIYRKIEPAAQSSADTASGQVKAGQVL